MQERIVTVQNAHGLHARPAALFVQKAGTFPCALLVVKGDGRTGDAKSILAIMSLGVEQGEQIVLQAEGIGADEALCALASLLETSES